MSQGRDKQTIEFNISNQASARVKAAGVVAPAWGKNKQATQEMIEMSETEIAKAIIAEFAHERTTKNTYRYAETSAIPEIGTLYIQKFALGAEPPQRLRVCVEAV